MQVMTARTVRADEALSNRRVPDLVQARQERVGGTRTHLVAVNAPAQPVPHRRADKTPDILTAARAEALFSSGLPTGENASPAEVKAAICATVRSLGSCRNCAAQVAREYGDHPETAVPRMRWALTVVRSAFPPPHCPGTASGLSGQPGSPLPRVHPSDEQRESENFHHAA
jgi:hypothetical protein